MAARHHYPHDEVDGRTTSELQELLFRKGMNFNDYPAAFKRGAFVRRVAALRELGEEELSGISPEYRPEPGAAERRYSVVRLPVPRFTSVTNREAVIFNGAALEVAAGIG